MNLQLKDPSGNVLVSLESTPVTPTVESMTTDLAEATKAVESAFDETELWDFSKDTRLGSKLKLYGIWVSNE